MAEYLQAPPRRKALGLLADALTSGQEALNTVNLPYVGGLGGLLFGQAPQYLQDVSYGMPAFRGGNVATGGLGTLTPDTRMLDVATLPFVGAGAAKAGQVGAKTLGKEVARQVETGTGLIGSNVLDPRQYATAYHGSPAIFDKFDINKVGSGEGMQAYGHGMYFAENPNVAKSYTTAGLSVKAPDRATEFIIRAKEATTSDEAAKQFLKKRLSDATEDVKPYLQQALNNFDSFKGGNFYKVDIPNEYIPDMLNWDKPLKGQNFSLLNYVDNIPPSKRDTFTNLVAKAKHNDMTVGSFYEELSKELGSAQKASEYLQKAGVPGIKYLDEGSRGMQAGTQNFVVFDPSQVKILERNNKGLLK